MEGNEEQDTCRICSAPAEAESPLFYPCKCSGTIKYIHQDCLKTWLEHSKKKKCDVCNHPYGFTKVYSPDMPVSIPSYLFVRRMFIQVFRGISFTIRGGLVGFVWLFVLPYATVISWRLFFYLGDRIAWWICNRPRPVSLNAEPFSPTKVSFSNVSRAIEKHNGRIPDDIASTFVASLWSDIFTGQIIASGIFMVFIGIFILREYILQNARPGLLGEIIPPVGEQQLVVPAPAPLPVPPPGAGAEAHDEGHHSSEGSGATSDDDNEEEDEEGENGAAVGSDAESMDALRQRKRQRVKSEDDSSDSSWIEVNNNNNNRDGGSSNALKREWSPQQVPEDIEPDPEREEVLDQLRQVNRLLKEEDAKWKDALTQFKKTRPLKRRIAAPVASTSASAERHQQQRAPNPGPPAAFYPLDRTRAAAARSQQSYTPPRPPRPAFSTADSGASGSRATFDFTFRPPPLPTANLPPQDESTVTPPPRSDSLLRHQPDTLDLSSVFDSPRRPPLPTAAVPSSPSYRAPEELEDPGYFDNSPEFSPTESHPDAYPPYSSPTDDEQNLETASATTEDLDVGDEDEEMHNVDLQIAPPSDSDGEGEEDDLEMVVPPVPQVPPAADGAAPIPQVAAGEQGVQPQDAEVVGEEDDMEALQGAIGMRGPVHVIIQHAALVMILLDVAIALIVGLPYTLGKTFAMLTLDPKRMGELLNSPLLVVRVITDPIVDLAMIFMGRVAFKLAQHLPQSAMDFFTSNPEVVVNPTTPWRPFDQLLNLGSVIGQRLSEFETSRYVLQYVFSATEEVKAIWASVAGVYASQAYGDTVRDRILVTIYGHSIIFLLALFYLYATSTPNERATGMNAVLKQLVIVVKVAFFMVVELILFPLLCGVVLDVATLKFFQEATIATRWTYLFYAPVTVSFCHWLAGTVYMYHFAVTLSTCRGIMRPGAMWFIKDPQDPTFQPIREILDRQAFQQLKKLALSALMYTLFICVGFMGATTVLSYISFAGSAILPLRWNLRRPLWSVPIDLLFMHIIAPLILKHARPRRTARRMIRYWWHFSARCLRLSSYMFDGDFPEERVSYPGWFTRENGKFDGSYRRVPKRDAVALVRGKNTLVETDKNGIPLTLEGEERMELQNVECLKAKRKVEDDYQVIYVPPNFARRMLAFCIGTCVVGVMTSVTLIAGPIGLGRQIFSYFNSDAAHDGYCFVLGGTLFWSCFFVARQVDQSIKRRSIRLANQKEDPLLPVVKEATLPLYVLKRGTHWLGRASWLLLCLGVVIPFLMALVADLYLVLPLRLIFNPDLVPRVNVLETWALGVVYLKLFVRIMRHRDADTELAAGIEKVRQVSWSEPNALSLTTDVIGPFIGGLLLLILFPPALWMPLQWIYLRSFPETGLLDDRAMFRYIYPLLFVAALASQAVDSFRKILKSWAQIIRDNEFLLELRLKNLEQEKEAKAATQEAVVPVPVTA